MLFGFRLAADTLPSGVLMRGGSRFALICFRLSPLCRLDVSIPSTSSGQRGITPAFGYGAPHPSAGGTSTLLTITLPSAHYGPFRLPDRPSLSLAGCSLACSGHRLGSPVLRWLPLAACRRLVPRQDRQRGSWIIPLTVTAVAFPYRGGGSAPALSRFRGLLDVHVSYGPHAR